MRIGILGGTGKEGSGLGLRWAHAGHEVVIGSRERAKAERIALELNRMLGREAVIGRENLEAARLGEVVVLTVPYAAHQATLESVREALPGKVLVDVTVPLDPAAPRRVKLPPAGSAAMESQQLLGPGVRVVAAFHNVSAEHLKELGHPIDCDVLVCGDDKAAKALVIGLAKDAGMRAFDAGPLANAVVPEGLTSVLIHINVRFKIKHAGIRITGIPDDGRLSDSNG